jgi:hypothetical protein
MRSSGRKASARSPAPQPDRPRSHAGPGRRNAIAIYEGRPPNAHDRAVAARWLCRPGGPLQRFEPKQFVLMNGFDANSMIG